MTGGSGHHVKLVDGWGLGSLVGGEAGRGRSLPAHNSQPAERGRQGAAEQGCGGALVSACLPILSERTFTEPSTRCCGQRRASRRSGSSRQSSILGVGDRRRCCRPWAYKNGATRRSSLGSLDIRKKRFSHAGLRPRVSLSVSPPPSSLQYARACVVRAPASQSVARDRDATLNEWAAARCPLLFDRNSWIHSGYKQQRLRRRSLLAMTRSIERYLRSSEGSEVRNGSPGARFRRRLSSFSEATFLNLAPFKGASQQPESVEEHEVLLRS